MWLAKKMNNIFAYSRGRGRRWDTPVSTCEILAKVRRLEKLIILIFTHGFRGNTSGWTQASQCSAVLNPMLRPLLQIRRVTSYSLYMFGLDDSDNPTEKDFRCTQDYLYRSCKIGYFEIVPRGQGL